MADYVYTPKKPYYGKDPLFSLAAFDTLTFNYAGLAWFISEYAPFATMAGFNNITVNAFMRSHVSAFYTVGTADYNTLVNWAGIDTTNAIVMNGSNNTIYNFGDILGFNDDAVVMNGNGFSITNTRLISAAEGIALKIKGDSGSITSSGDLGFRGVIHGGVTGIQLQGSFNNIHFWNTGRIITDERSIDGLPDRDGLGAGLLLEGHNNNVQLYQVIAGYSGASINGDDNTLTVDAVKKPGGGEEKIEESFTQSAEEDPSGAIIAKVGVQLTGKHNTFINTGTIDGDILALDVEGDLFEIHNTGILTGDKIAAVHLHGSHGKFTSVAGGVIGKTALILEGDYNVVVANSIAGTSAIGTAFYSRGAKNTLTLNEVSASGNGIDLWGEKNTINLQGIFRASGDAIVTNNYNNQINVEFRGDIQAANAIRMKGQSSILINSGRIQGEAFGADIQGDDARVTNNRYLGGILALNIQGKGAQVTNNFDGKINGSTKIVGANAILTNWGEMHTLETYAAYVGGNNFSVVNMGKIEGGISLAGDHGNLINNGTISNGELRGYTLQLSGSDVTVTNIGTINATYGAVKIDGQNNKFHSQYGTIFCGPDTGIIIDGNDNEMTLGPLATLSARASAFEAKGINNSLWVQGVINSSDVVIGPEGIVHLDGLKSRFKNDGSITSRSLLRNPTVHIKGDEFNVENNGVIVGNIALYINGDNGEFIGNSKGSLIGRFAGLGLEGDHNKARFEGYIEGRDAVAAVVAGDDNTVALWNIRGLSEEDSALKVMGDINKISIWGDVDSAANDGLTFTGVGNEIRIEETGSISSQKRSILISGDNSTIDNYGELRGSVEFYGQNNTIRNYHYAKGVYAYLGTMQVINAETGTITGEKGIVGEGINQAVIGNSGHIVGQVGEAIWFSFGDFPAADDHVGIWNKSTGVIESLGEGKNAIRVDGIGYTALDNDGIIKGTVSLGSGNDIVKNEGEIWGRAEGEIDGDKFLVGVFLGDGENKYYSDHGQVFGEIWGGDQKDWVYTGIKSATVVRGFDGRDILIAGGADTLYGGASKDELGSFGGNAYLDGGEDDDTLWSEIGNNTLVGGSGEDHFYIAHEAVEGMADTFIDFEKGVDRIVLIRDYFPNISAGPELGFGEFAYVGGFISPFARILYDASSGDLFFDEDGSSDGHSPIKLAHFKGAPLLTASDFTISSIAKPSLEQNLPSAFKSQYSSSDLYM